MVEDEPEICRVCRSEATSTQPLFHPCKCSGSIKYVHQDCLLEWLEHSNKRYCELCKHSFAFTPIYAPNMPERIPRSVLVSRAIEKLASGIRIIMRAILVATIWLLILPYFSVWIWRLYFWIGESFAFKANGLESPSWNSTSFFASRNFTLLTSGNQTLGDHYNGTTSVESSIMQFIARTFPEKHQWVSKFVLDCFEGQIISSVVVVVFVAMFLLQEWVIQNADLDADRRMDGLLEDPELVQAPPVHFADEDPIEEAADQLVEQDAGRGFNIEQAMERLIAAQHQIQAMMDGEADVEESDKPVPPEQAPHNVAGTSGSATAGPSTLQRQLSSGVAFENTTNSLDELQRRPNQGGAFGSLESSSSPTTDSNARTNLYYDTNRFRQGQSVSSSHSTNNSNGEGASGRQQSNTEGSDVIRSKSGRLFYWDEHETTPLTMQNVFMNADGSEMTLDQQLKKYDELLKTEDLAFSEVRRLPMKWRTNHLFARGSFATNPSPEVATSTSGSSSATAAASNADAIRGTTVNEGTAGATGPMGANEVDEWGIRALDPEAVRRRQVNEERRRLLNAAQERARMRAAQRLHNPPAPAPARALAPAPAPVQPPGAQPAEPRMGGFRAQFGDDALRGEPDDDFDEMGAEELHGILEVIGMHGPYWILLQNSLLMSALICATLGVGVWIPYMIGKTTLLMNPSKFFRLPIQVLNKLTDPITDFIIDSVGPWLVLATKKVVGVVSRQIGPIVEPFVVQYLGGETLQPLMNVTKEYMLPLWETLLGMASTGVGHASNSTAASSVMPESATVSGTAIVETVLGTASINGTAAGAAPVIVLSPVMVMEHVLKRWSEIAYGNTSNDKFIAIMLGYVILFIAAYWYMDHTRHSYGQTLSRVLRDIIRQQGMILKIAFFVSIEMVAFPLFCGALISLSTLPVFKGATLASRLAFYMQSPNWSIIMHWIVGTAFMFNFSMFVGACRGMVRPGVMWFIRDPNDPGFHPIREILERPVTMQLRKLSMGALMYMVLILGGIAVTSYSISFCLPGVFPLRLPVDRPLSDVPLDLLLFWLGPTLVRTMAISDRVKWLFEAWWRKTSQQLRLSSFMYGKDGERYPEEEGHVEYRTWRAWFMQVRPEVPDIDQAVEDVTAPGAEAIFVRDGGLYRVPNTDRILHLKDRRVLVPVDEEGNALDPREDLPGEVDPTTDGQFHVRGVQRPPQDPKEDTVIVYGPPDFKRRMLVFVIVLWASVMTFCAAVVLLPIVAGRLFTKWYLGSETLHDSITFFWGAFILGGLWFLADRLTRVVQFLVGREDTAATGQSDLGNLIRAKARVVGHAIWDHVKLTARMTYFAVTLGVIVPLVTTLVLELYVFLPLRRLFSEDPGINFFLDWAFGFTFIRTILHTMFLMQEMGLAAAPPEAGFMANVNRLLVVPRVLDWNVGAVTTQLLVPFAAATLASLVFPSALACVVTMVIRMDEATQARVFRLIHPVSMVVLLVVVGTQQSYRVLSRWSQYVRDEEYLLGRELHNLEEEGDEQPMGGGASGQRMDVPAVGTTTTTTTSTTVAGTSGAGAAAADPDAWTKAFERLQREQEEEDKEEHERRSRKFWGSGQARVSHSATDYDRPVPSSDKIGSMARRAGGSGGSSGSNSGSLAALRNRDTALRRQFQENWEDLELMLESPSATDGEEETTKKTMEGQASGDQTQKTAFWKRVVSPSMPSASAAVSGVGHEDGQAEEEDEEDALAWSDVTQPSSRDKGKGKKTVEEEEDRGESDVWTGGATISPAWKQRSSLESGATATAAGDEDEVEGDSIAARTRLRRSQRLQALGSRRSSHSGSAGIGH